MSRPRIAVTLGDPRGIGPEITGRALATAPTDVDITLVGPDDLIASLPATARLGVGTWHAGTGEGSGSEARTRAIRAGTLAGRAIETAAGLALSGVVDAIVTAPIEKHATRLAGFDYPGHTEWLAHLAGGADVAMMLAAEGTPTLRVVLVTTHVALRDVPALLTPDRIVKTGHVTSRALRHWWGIAEPRLAVCALNPHAGEKGLFGDEEARVLGPAVQALGAAGPVPADTVFVRAMRGEFDAVLAPYHDVGMTAIKVAAFGRAVNVTLGLPFPRTSPDHGTALDIAGTGRADPGSMAEALRLAARLAARRG
ncbi:MAG TPA: 4-hydroxythreonine-4-phosphate dehydrogenase PdxA [Gemmatimonadales bacterium]|nr:4-hydroxythreonine-4-phosphate dehydrogenase PdxA [Gemmatimonadales bacterium]